MLAAGVALVPLTLLFVEPRYHGVKLILGVGVATVPGLVELGGIAATRASRGPSRMTLFLAARILSSPAVVFISLLPGRLNGSSPLPVLLVLAAIDAPSTVRTIASRGQSGFTRGAHPTVPALVEPPGGQFASPSPESYATDAVPQPKPEKVDVGRVIAGICVVAAGLVALSTDFIIAPGPFWTLAGAVGILTGLFLVIDGLVGARRRDSATRGVRAVLVGVALLCGVYFVSFADLWWVGSAAWLVLATLGGLLTLFCAALIWLIRGHRRVSADVNDRPN